MSLNLKLNGSREASGPMTTFFGDRHLVTPNEPEGLVIYYYLKSKIEGQINIKLTDPFGRKLARFTGPNNPGLNSIIWDMRRPIPREAGPQPGLQPRNILDQLVEPGRKYVVILEAGGKRLAQKARITRTIGWQIDPSPQLVR